MRSDWTVVIVVFFRHSLQIFSGVLSATSLHVRLPAWVTYALGCAMQRNAIRDWEFMSMNIRCRL